MLEVRLQDLALLVHELLEGVFNFDVFAEVSAASLIVQCVTLSNIWDDAPALGCV